jgi:hypothetical protein
MATQAYGGRTGGSSMVSALDRPGWLTFAAVVMFAVGVMRVISAIYYFADSNRINNLTLGAFGQHLFFWGLWDLAIAVLAFFAASSLLSNNGFGRAVGYVWAVAVIVESFLMIGWASWWGFGSAALGVLVIYALSTTSGWEDTRPAASSA